ncbi:MAG: hypothetical protein JW741_06590, partial [Sedimentisphaerales bacterium]|nr:hypothetical protein [Sedimentisphaerales bacterium]
MAEPSISLSYPDLMSEVAQFVGLGPPTSAWVSDQVNEDSGWESTDEDRLDGIVQAGLRQFLYPPPVGDEAAYIWSFLKKVGTVATVNADYEYDLPDDFAGDLISISFPEADGGSSLDIIDEAHLRALYANDDQDGTPLYAAVRAKTFTAATGQRYELLLYPKPTAIKTLTFCYSRGVDSLDPSDTDDTPNYPPGGPAYSHVLVESCLAIAEERWEDGAGDVHQQQFLRKLAAAITRDKALHGATTPSWPATSPTGMEVTYDDLVRAVGRYLGYGPNSAAWTYSQTERVDDIVQAGIRQFLYPPSLKEDEPQYRWSFLDVAATISVNDTTDPATYDLAAGCGGAVSRLVYAAGDQERPVDLVSRERLLALRASDSTTTGPPKYAAVVPEAFDATAGQQWQVELYPAPDTSYTFTYWYAAQPTRATSTNKYLRGGAEHGETIVASCLAAAEMDAQGQAGARAETFLRRLTFSVQQDRLVARDVAEPQAEPIATTLGTVYGDLLQAVGRYLRFGPAPSLWTEAQRIEADRLVQAGLHQFYHPPAIDGVSHVWSFLRIHASLDLTDEDYDYDLPADCESIYGPITWTDTTTGKPCAEWVSDESMRQFHQGSNDTGRPAYYTVRAKTSTGSAAQVKEVVFYPIPDSDDYVGQYTYVSRGQRLSSSAPYPLGGDEHAETL